MLGLGLPLGKQNNDLPVATSDKSNHYYEEKHEKVFVSASANLA